MRIIHEERVKNNRELLDVAISLVYLQHFVKQKLEINQGNHFTGLYALLELQFSFTFL
jgi:hypothetical protein